MENTGPRGSRIVPMAPPDISTAETVPDFIAAVRREASFPNLDVAIKDAENNIAEQLERLWARITNRMSQKIDDVLG